jgi:hypothetical protein
MVKTSTAQITRAMSAMEDREVLQEEELALLVTL